MNKQMIIAGLKARPVRTTVSLLAVALEVVLILVVVGLTSGISDETGRRTEGVGADILLQPPNSSLFLALSNTTMPIVLRERLRELPGIKAITPVQTLVNSSAGLEIIYGIEPDTFDAVSNGFIWHKGRLFNAPDEVVVDDIYAKAKGVTVGDTVELVNHKFKVCGIVEHGKGARLFISLKMAQEMTGQTGKASLFFIKLTHPDRVETAIAEIKRLLEGYGVITLSEYARLMMSNSMTELDAFISSVAFIALCIGVLVIFLSMYTTITERTREIGILRSLGASKTFIVTLIFEESAAVCSAGALIGIGSSFLIARIIMAVVPTLTVFITPGWVTKGGKFAVLSGIIGTLFSSFNAGPQGPGGALPHAEGL